MSSDKAQDVDISSEIKDSSPGPGLPSVATSDVASIAESTRSSKPRVTSTSSERQIKVERAQKCLENAALVTKRIKEHRKATAELLGRPFEEDDPGDTASELASNVSERTGYSVATDTSTTLSVQDALNIPGISESLANTLRQKELLMERIKQYKEISKKPMVKKTTTTVRRESSADVTLDPKTLKTDVNLVREKDNVISVMQVKMKAMETTIMDLQEKIGEKDMIIDAKTKATSLMSDNLSKKEKDSMVLLEDTRQQMTKMQENFIAMEVEWNEEKARLVKQIEEKDEIIKHLEEANTILENSRFEISVDHSKIIKEMEEKNLEISELQMKLNKLAQSSEPSTEILQKCEEEKGSIEISNMVELSKRIELLEQINCQIRQTNKELENKLTLVSENKPSVSSPKKSNQPSPLPTRKGRNTASKSKSPWSNLEEPNVETDKKQTKADVSKMEAVIQSLNKEIIEKEFTISQKDETITRLQSLISEKESVIQTLKNDILDKESTLENLIAANSSKTDVKVESTDHKDLSCIIKEATEHKEPLSADIKELETKLEAAQQQISLLSEEVDAANKNMIKVKSSHKLKVKQMQKTIDNFSKVSDVNAEVTKLNEEVHQLTQKVAELEEEKGNLQLHLVDYDSGRLTESEIYQKLREVESLAATRLKSISTLETQKFDLAQDLHLLQQKNIDLEDKLADMSHLQSEHVCSEIQTVQLEEQLDELLVKKKELELITENLKLDNEQMSESIKKLKTETHELTNKLENYIQENIELNAKLEKLTAEKVSSAESIEIVESLTTQEKLELEEYNKRVATADKDKQLKPEECKIPQYEFNEALQKHMEEHEELNKKIELFTLERQEVMEKMNAINAENELLQNQILHLTENSGKLQDNITLLNNERQDLHNINIDLNNQIEELKRERIEIMKETSALNKPISNVEEISEIVVSELQSDDKSIAEKSGKGVKTVKQLTKDILKLKNIIKEREAEIGDCQMKILSLEEQEQKHVELIHTNETYETKIKALLDEKNALLEELKVIKQVSEDKMTVELRELSHSKEMLRSELNTIHNEYNATIHTRDSKITELEGLLADYEKQIINFNNTLQVKDKQMSEYVNQITKLNDVSQKLKSTIECLEEEKARDQNGELVKSLNKKIGLYQKTLKEYEDKFTQYEEEKSKLLSMKSLLETKNANIENELKLVQEALSENQKILKEMQLQKQKYSEDISVVNLHVKERDEEIHEIKLQLRKESIENEKLRNELTEKENLLEIESKKLEEVSRKLNDISIKTSGILEVKNNELTEKINTLEIRNNELMEKLKKFAVALKKKTALCSDLEAQVAEFKKDIQRKSEELVNSSKNFEDVSNLQEKIVALEGQLKDQQSDFSAQNQESLNDILYLQETNKTLQEALTISKEELNEVSNLREKIAALEGQLKDQQSEFSLQEQEKLNELLYLQNELATLKQELTEMTKVLNLNKQDSFKTTEESLDLKSQIKMLNQKLTQLVSKQQDNDELLVKISTLEADISSKASQITHFANQIEVLEQNYNQMNYGHDAKLQERDLYIENLETEISKYKGRIARLEESISEMEDRRHSLERKADQLDVQLQEKYKAYSEYTNQEDELINRLVVLMDHDRVVEKQLHEIEKDNKDLLIKIQDLNEDNTKLRTIISDIQSQYEVLAEKASKSDAFETQLGIYVEKNRELENFVKKMTTEHQTVLMGKNKDIEDIEMEFNTQIENSLKEKKHLIEKHEKINEHVILLEQKVDEYKTTNDNLSINLEEVTKLNQELYAKLNTETIAASKDYTEQYIEEINKLNASINDKNQELENISEHYKQLQTNSNQKMLTKQAEIDSLNNQLVANSEVITKLNQDLYNVVNTEATSKDRTEQYVEEINKLTAAIDFRNKDIDNITQQYIQLQTNSNQTLLAKQAVIDGLNNQLAANLIALNNLAEELEAMKIYNSKLKEELHQNTEYVKSLKDNNTVSFEMNIPKTEGMIISSTIEQLSAGPSLQNYFDMASIESQIITDTTDSNATAIVKQHYDKTKQDNTIHDDKKSELSEGEFREESKIVPQKAYLCYKNSEDSDKLDTTGTEDPFNSDEGWGFEVSGAASTQMLADFSQLNQQILELKKCNEKLQTELDSANVKLSKTMKKIKVLKTNNDALTNELRLSQMSQPAILDSTMEDELRVQVQDLIKNVDDLNSKLISESRERESLHKLNEQLKSTNNKLSNQKEKLDNEIELWKYKFREANDKLSSVQWEAEPKQEPASTKTDTIQGKDELTKLEKENDELQSEIDDLTKQNNELNLTLSKLRDELKMVKENSNMDCSNCVKLHELRIQIETTIQEQQRESELQISRLLQVQNENQKHFDDSIKAYESKFSELKEAYQSLQNDLLKANNQISDLKVDLSNAIEKLKLAEEKNQTFDTQKEHNDIKIYETLKKQYEDLQLELCDSNTFKTLLENDKEEITKKLKCLEAELEEVNKIKKELNSENDQLLSTVAELRNSVSTAVDQRGYEIAEMWKQHLSQRENDFAQIEQDLREQLTAAEVKYEQLLENVQSSNQEETSKLIMMEQFNSSQTKLKDKEEHLMTLQNKCTELINQIDILRSEAEDEKMLHENRILNLQEEFEKQVSDLTAQQLDANTHNEEILKLQSDLLSEKEENCKKDILIEELKSKTNVMELKLREVIAQISVKDNEIFEKTRDYTIVHEQRNEQFEIVRQQLLEYEKKIEELTHEKESELAVLRLKMHENLSYYEDKIKGYENVKVSLTESLNLKIQECTSLNKELEELKVYLQENADKMSEMQTALENQEFEIVTLKDEIDNMQELLNAASKMEKRVTFASDTKPAAIAKEDEELLEPVPKAELDLALYMLHQRDVRCEELTMELTQLLDERDTLQLRLSDSIRSYEDLKMRSKLAGLDLMSTSSQETIPESSAISGEKDLLVDVHKSQTSRSSSVSEGDPDKTRLQAKLSELRSVRQSRDLRLRNDSEQRDISMRLLQRDVANLPPEAAEQLRQAHHTLSRDSQSTSTVLLNWLRGKSTPKVVHM